MRKGPHPMAHIIFVLLMAVMLIGFLLSYTRDADKEEEQRANPVSFNPDGSDREFSELKPALLYDFASNYNESIFYCFAFDQEYRVYVVAISEKDMDRYEELFKYSYSTDVNAAVPEQVILQGMPVLIEEEIAELAVESYNEFTGTPMVNTDNYKFAFGSYYLDTTTESVVDYGFAVLCAALAVLTLISYIIYLMSRAKSAKVTEGTLARIGGSALRELDQEINGPSAVSYQKQKLYLTQNYIVTYGRGLEIIPYTGITRVYGNSYGGNFDKRRYSIAVDTADGREHEFALTPHKLRWENELNPIIAQLKEKLPEIPFGTEESFYIHNKTAFHTDADIQEAGELRSSNMLLGILGALIGAILGGIIWIIIGKFGFIAGIAGYFTMLFAINGYRKLSGFLDKKGQIISILIAFLAILAANYALYLIEFMKYFFDNSYTLGNMKEALKTLPELMSMSDAWGDFLKDLAIGYLLSLWASINILRSVFRGKKKDE